MNDSSIFERVMKAADGMTALADKLSERVQVVNHWRYRGFPRDRCPDIENALGGRVTCEVMRPDVRWVRVPDASWPHPSGRPCIDVAQEA